MASIYDLKPLFQSLLRPIVKLLAARGVSANQVTVCAAAGSIILGVLICFFSNNFFLLMLPLWLFLRMALNAIDGMLAREFNQKSRLGGILNELCDLVSDCALYLPFALIAPCKAFVVVLVVILALIVEAAGILRLENSSSRRYHGPFGKSDRAFAFGLLALFLFFGVNSPVWVNAYLVLLALLAMLTIYIRCAAALSELKAT